MDFGNLTVEKVIVHDIFAKSSSGEIRPPEYSSALTVLNADIEKIITDRIISTVGSGSNCVQMDILDSTTGSVFYKVSQIISNTETFITLSQEMALKLSQSQTHPVIPGGVLVVVYGSYGVSRNKYVALIKAEKHSGLRLNRLNLEFLANLLLTPQQKLYKVGFFAQSKAPEVDGEYNPDQFYALVFDQNINKNGSGTASQYFYQTFLGCTHIINSKKLTSQFYEDTKKFINQSNHITPENKVNITTALHTYLKTEISPTINAPNFASRYFPNADMIDEYIEFLNDVKLPLIDIQKDTSLISSKLKRRSIKFTSDVAILFPSGAENNDNIEIIGYNGEENKTSIKIKGRVNNQVR